MKRLILLLAAPFCALALLIASLSGAPASVLAEVTPLAPGATQPQPTATPLAASAGLISATPITGAPGYTPVPPAAAPRAATATPVPTVCGLGPEFRQAGDQTVVLGGFAMDLPLGDFIVASYPTTVQVCFTPDAGVLTLSSASGGELNRTARSGASQAAFDAIVASVRPPFDATRGVRVPTLRDAPPPGVELPPPPPGNNAPPSLTGIAIRPPSTGDAGIF